MITNELFLAISESDFELLLEKKMEGLKVLLRDLSPEKVDELIPSKDVPSYLKVSRRTWQRYRDERLIPFSQIGRKIWVKRSDLDAFIKKGMIGRSDDNNF